MFWVYIDCISLLYIVSTFQSSHAISSSLPTSSSDGVWGSSSTSIFGPSMERNMIWDQEYLTSRITVRLVRKSWTPKGLKNDKYVDEFPGDVLEAYNILRNNTDYDYIERPLSKAAELFTIDSEFAQDYDNIILIHPMFSSADDTYWAIPTLTALAMRNVHKHTNIFLYHMPHLHSNQFLTVLLEVFGYETHYEEMAEAISTFLLEGVRLKHWTPSQMNFIGYSYSGNLAGYVARYLYYATNTKVDTILSLDPYSAQYNENLLHVGRRYAEVVHTLHASSYAQGTRERVATADFVFNDGFIQPECRDPAAIWKRMMSFKMPHEPMNCSHLRITQRFWYLILYPSKFQARQCETWPLFRQCECEDGKQTFLSYPIVNRDAQGTFYLRTTGTKPYGLGEEGSHCSPKAKEKFKEFQERIKEKMKQPIQPKA